MPCEPNLIIYSVQIVPACLCISQPHPRHTPARHSIPRHCTPHHCTPLHFEENVTDPGHVYVYELLDPPASGAGAGAESLRSEWVLAQDIQSPVGPRSRFGSSVAMRGDLTIVGALGFRKYKSYFTFTHQSLLCVHSVEHLRCCLKELFLPHAPHHSDQSSTAL